MRTPASSSSRWSRSAALLLVAGLAWQPGDAGAQDTAEVPAVTATPVDRDAPNGGQWFAVEADPGETVELTAQVANPAQVAQTVQLYLAELRIENDTPAVGDRGAGVGAWGAFDQPERTLEPRQVLTATFRVTVPTDAEPGDNIGAVVAESGATGPAGGVGVVKRVAQRLYVTVSGDAEASLEIDELDRALDRALLPRELRTSFLVRNTGRIRLDVEVTVNGRRAEGPETIVSQSAEPYEVALPVSVWGGSKDVDVRVTSRTALGEGPSDEASTSVLVVPWWILLAAFLLVLGAFAVRELRRRLA